MDASATARWFPDPNNFENQGMIEDPSFHQWELGSLEQFINAENFWDDIQHCFTSSSNAAVSGSSMDSYRPKKTPKTTSRGSTSTTAAAAAEPKTTSASPSILSFGNPEVYETRITPKGEAGVGVGCAVAGSRRSFDGRVKRPVAARPPSQNQDHIIAERKRREKLSQRFIALSAMIPGLKKMDKASILGDAIEYLKQLQDQVNTLEEERLKMTAESAVIVNKCQVSDDDASSCEVADLDDEHGNSFEVQAKLSGNAVLLRIHCKKSKGLLVKILAEIETLKLSVLNTSCIPFVGSALDITVMAQVEEGFSLTAKELAEKLNAAFIRQFM